MSPTSSLASSASPVRVGRSIKDSGSVLTRRPGSSPRPHSLPDSEHHVAVACAAATSPRSCPVAHVGMSRILVPGEGLATKQTQNGLGGASLQPCMGRGADDLPPRAQDHVVTLAAAVKQRSRERTPPRQQEEQEKKSHRKTLEVLVQPVPHEDEEHQKQFQEVDMEQQQPQQAMLEPFAAQTEAKQGLQLPDGSLPELALRQADPVDPASDVEVTGSPRQTMVSHSVDPERATMLRIFRRHAHGAWLVAKAKDMAMTCSMWEDEEAAVTSIANTLKTEESYLLACRNIFDRFSEKAMNEDGECVCELPLSTFAEVLKLWNINADHSYTFFALVRKERSEWFEGELPLAIDADVFEATFKKFLRRIRDHICNTKITKQNFVHAHERRGSFEREFTEGDWVGAGAFGDCCLVTDNYTQKKCVMKKIPKCNAMVPVEELDFELQALRSLDHPNVVRVFESFDAEDHIALILEAAHGGDLKLKLAKAKEDGKISLEHKFVRNIMHQGVKGLAYVHSKCIIHRDIKPANLLLATHDEERPLLLITDFGVSEIFKERSDEEGVGFTLKGSPSYMAPEVYQNVVTPRSDVWALGVCAYELLCGTRPFRGENPEQLHESVKNTQVNYDALHGSPAVMFLKQALVKVETERKAAQELFSCRWFEEISKEVLRVRPKRLAKMQRSLRAYAASSYFTKVVMNCVAAHIDTSEVGILNSIFISMDVEGDGMVPVSDAVMGLKKLGIEADDLEQIVDALDINRSERIGYSAFIAGLLWSEKKALDQTLQRVFRIFDENKDDLISVQELDSLLSGSGFSTAVFPDGSTIGSTMRDIASARDGGFSFAELRRFLAQEWQSLDIDAEKVADIVRKLGSSMHRSEDEIAAQARHLSERMWITTVKDLRELNCDGWSGLQLPMKLERALKDYIGV